MGNIGNNLLEEAKNYVDTIIWNGRNLEINWKEEISYKEVSLTKRKFLYDFLVKKLVEILKIKGIKVLGIDYINFQISCLKKTSAKHSKIKNSETIYNQTLEIVDIVEKEYNKNEENIKLIDKIDMALYQLLKEEKIESFMFYKQLDNSIRKEINFKKNVTNKEKKELTFLLDKADISFGVDLIVYDFEQEKNKFVVKTVVGSCWQRKTYTANDFKKIYSHFFKNYNFK